MSGHGLAVLGERPFRYVTDVRVEPGRAFFERSSSLLQRAWEHERTLAPLADSTEIVDRMRFEARVSLLAPPIRPIVAGLLRHRHRHLRAHFGQVSGDG